MFSIFNQYISLKNEKWKIGILLIFLIFFLPQINFAQTDTNTVRKKDTTQKLKGRSPKVAALRAAVLPGWGQIYNKKYWKLPLVYGGAIGLGYGIYWNNAYYQYYRGIYQQAVLTNNLTINRDQVALLRNEFRRSKEQLIIGSVVFYGLTVVDAIVDAHFSTYDISDDLTLRVYPKINFSPQGQAYLATTVQFGIKNKKKLQP